MRTTISIDDSLMQTIMQSTGQKSAVAAIRQALAAYAQQSRKDKVLALRGQVAIDGDWQALRALDVQASTPTAARRARTKQR